MTEELLKRIESLEMEVRDLRSQEAIRNLRFHYHQCINEAKFDEIPALFTEDATLDFGYLGRTRGREKIGKFFSSGPDLLPFVKQFIHNHVIEVNGDSGSGFSYMEAKSISGGKAYLVAGRYDDDYAVVSGEWRFARMDFDPYFTVPFSEPEGWAQTDKLQMGKK